MTPEEIVDEFIARIERRDVAGAFELCTDDVVYDNVPMPTAEGKEAALAMLEPFAAMASAIEWVVHRQAASGDVVLNERTDRFLVDGRWIEIAVAGVFEVRDGRIALWRDYFDLGAFNAQLAG